MSIEDLNLELLKKFRESLLIHKGVTLACSTCGQTAHFGVPPAKFNEDDAQYLIAVCMVCGRNHQFTRSLVKGLVRDTERNHNNEEK